MDFFEVLDTQRAIRHFRPDPVPDALVRRVLEAAVRAPSGGNRQTWRFVVVRDPGLKARLGALYHECFETILLEMPYYKAAAAAPPESPEGRMLASSRHLAEHLGEAPVLVLACIDAAGQRPGIALGASIYPAVQNLLLAARALGLGTTLTTIHRFKDADVKALLGVPEGVETAALVPLGWPATRFGHGPRRELQEVAFLDRWGNALPA